MGSDWTPARDPRRCAVGLAQHQQWPWYRGAERAGRLHLQVRCTGVGLAAGAVMPAPIPGCACPAARDLPLHRHFRRHRPFSVKVGASTAKRLRVTSSWSTAGSVATLDDEGSRNNPAGAGFGSGKGFSSVARSPKALTVTASIMKATRRLQGEGVPLSRHHAQPNL